MLTFKFFNFLTEFKLNLVYRTDLRLFCTPIIYTLGYKHYMLLYFEIIDQSVPMLSAISVVLKIFLKKIIKIKPIENSTLARVNISNDNVYI